MIVRCVFILFLGVSAYAAPAFLDDGPSVSPCSLCQSLVSQTRGMVKKHMSEGQIKQHLNAMCRKEAGQFERQCESFVSANGHHVIDEIKHGKSPIAICREYHYCVIEKDEVKFSDGCFLCQVVVSAARQRMNKGESEAQIRKDVLRSCNSLPSYQKRECQEFVKYQLHTIVECLKVMNPNIICIKLRHCQKLREYQPIRMDDDCMLCELVVSDTSHYMKQGLNQAQIRALLLKNCRDLSKQKYQQCAPFVLANLPIIMKYLKVMNPNQVCVKLFICSPRNLQAINILPAEDRLSAGNEPSSILISGPVRFHSKTDRAAVNSVKCNFCKLLVFQIDNMLKNNGSEDSIKKAADKLCSVIPLLSSQCKMFVDSNLAIIIEALEEMPPDQVCQELGVCKQLFHVGVEKSTTELNVGKSPSCLLCRAISAKIVEFLSKNSTLEDATKALQEAACGSISDEEKKAKCLEYMKNTTADLFVKLLKKFDARSMCAIYCFFPKTTENVILHVNPSVELSVGTSLQCKLCRAISAKILEFLEKNSTLNDTVAKLQEVVCGNLPGPIKDICIGFVANTTALTFKELKQKFNPKSMCFLQCLLPKAKEQVANQQVNSVKASLECEVCRKIAKDFDMFISQDSSLEQMKQMMHQFCKKIPVPLKGKCDEYIETHAPDIINILVNEYGPDMLCAFLNLCPASKITQVNKSIQKGGKPSLCQFCLGIMNIAKKMIDQNSTQEDVKKDLRMICNLMLPVRGQCLKFVDKFVPAVFDEIKKGDSPKEICTKLQFCEAQIDVRCYMKSLNICKDPALVKKCGKKAYCIMMGY